MDEKSVYRCLSLEIVVVLRRAKVFGWECGMRDDQSKSRATTRVGKLSVLSSGRRLVLKL